MDYRSPPLLPLICSYDKLCHNCLLVMHTCWALSAGPACSDDTGRSMWPEPLQSHANNAGGWAAGTKEKINTQLVKSTAMNSYSPLHSLSYFLLLFFRFFMGIFTTLILICSEHSVSKHWTFCIKTFCFDTECSRYGKGSQDTMINKPQSRCLVGAGQ